MPNLTYTNNVISREFFRRGGYWGPTTDCDHVARSGNNVWDGQYVPPAQQPPRRRPGSPARNRLSIRRAKALVRAALARELKKRFTRRVRPGHMSATARPGGA